MQPSVQQPRRQFLKVALGASAAFALTAGGVRLEVNEKKEKHEHEKDVSPTEDLMREHGVLRRILLIYGEIIRRVEGKKEVPAHAVAQAAQIVRVFVEDYHERDEEEYIFPRLQKAGQLTDLVNVLLAQHGAGRQMTAAIQQLATGPRLTSASGQQQLAGLMRQFIRMYEPHAAREDTVLFPAFVQLVSEKEMHTLMETFEQKEQALPLGNFEKMVADVAAIERTLDIYELAQFTPKAS